jgi:hypothetical protein
VICHPSGDLQAEQMGAMAQSLNRVIAPKVPRTHAGVTRFFTGLLVEPGHRTSVGVATGPGVDPGGTTTSTMWSGLARVPGSRA